MFPSSVSFTIDLRLSVKIFAAIVTIALFTSWSGLTTRHILEEQTGIAAFKIAEVRHVLAQKGGEISYVSNTGYLTVNDDRHLPLAHVFYAAYQLDKTNYIERPITFVFNGGPGSASVWLHMGSFGPVRINEQHKMEDNPDSWIGFTDLVFIDAVGTGYSRAAQGVNAQRFYGYHEDVSIMSAFIQQFLTQHGRLKSPVFLAGESYGGLRAIGLAEQLQQKYDIILAGLTLISPALNYQLISFKPGNETAYPYYIPTYAVTAQYYGKVDTKLSGLSTKEIIAKATVFAQGTYTQFLSLGDAASPKLTNEVIDSLSYFTGLKKEYLKRINGRIADHEFTQNLLGDTNKIIGTLDSRFEGSSNDGDPSLTALRKVFTACFQNYVSAKLHYHNKLPYLATTATHGWNYGPGGNNSYVNASLTLKNVINSNPQLRVNIVGGYYDLATPVGSTLYVLNHLGLNKNLRKNVSVNYYGAGHMIYTSDKANRQFKNDTENFYKLTFAAHI